METVLLVVLLILAVALIGVVLLQRSEGGGLGMGAGGVMTGRAQATALGRATWWIGAAFMLVSLLMTVVSAERAGSGSVVDRVSAPAADAGAEAPAAPDLGGEGGQVPPPATGGATEAPLVPTDQ